MIAAVPVSASVVVLSYVDGPWYPDARTTSTNTLLAPAVCIGGLTNALAPLAESRVPRA